MIDLIFCAEKLLFGVKYLIKYKPIAVINEQVAIEIAEVMYIEAKKRGIQYKAWMNNPMNGYFYWTTNPMHLSLDAKIFSKDPSLQSIELANVYIKSIIEKNERPYYLSSYLNITKIASLISSIKGLIRLGVNRLKRHKKDFKYESYGQSAINHFERSIRTFYRKYDSINDFKEYEIILYPLHYEPEASLSYLSEFYSNQVALIENNYKVLRSKSSFGG